jgi:hypothetical protein
MESTVRPLAFSVIADRLRHLADCIYYDVRAVNDDKKLSAEPASNPPYRDPPVPRTTS